MTTMTSYINEIEALRSTARTVEETAYSLAGKIDSGKVARLILIAAQLESFELDHPRALCAVT